jgi:hypothetical protein
MLRKETYQLEIGDVGGSRIDTLQNRIVRWIENHMITPEQDRDHFFILWQKIKDDWLILESIGSKGLTVGKLSWYDNQNVIFYRVDCDKDLRTLAPNNLINYARSQYDYFLIAKLITGAVRAFFKVLINEHKIRRFTARDFPYDTDRRLICTEAVEIAYLSVGVAIVDPEVLPIPQTFKEAELEGRIFKIEEISKR